MAATKAAVLPPPGTSLLDDNSSKKKLYRLFSQVIFTFQSLTMLMLKSEYLPIVNEIKNK